MASQERGKTEMQQNNILWRWCGLSLAQERSNQDAYNHDVIATFARWSLYLDDPATIPRYITQGLSDALTITYAMMRVRERLLRNKHL